jgi:outer membrane protein assembly factor BamB
LPGSGWSSPVVVGDRIWVTAAVETALAEQELTERLEQIRYGTEGFGAIASVRLLAIEVNLGDGGLLREIELFHVVSPPPIHKINSYASPTPVSDGKMLWCDFGSLGTAAVELASGRVAWKQTFAVDDITGPGCSPILVDNLLILVRDGADKQYLAALDKTTGVTVWQQTRPVVDGVEGEQRRAFVTPLLVEHEGRRQLVAPTANWAIAYQPLTGEALWWARLSDGYALVPRPTYAGGLVLVCTGYHRPQLVAIDAGGLGDVTDSHVRWTFDRQVPLIASPVVVDDLVYCISDNGVLSCVELMTGKLIWRQRMDGRYGASPLAADGRIYLTNDAGLTTVIRPGREYVELAKNQLFGHTMASLAVAGNRLLIRSSTRLVCIGPSEAGNERSVSGR